MRSFFGEGRIDPLTEPGLVLVPAPALVEQDLGDMEAVDALAHSLAIKANPACNCGGALAATGMPDDLGALRVLSRSRA
jgi:hypothetical protein